MDPTTLSDPTLEVLKDEDSMNLLLQPEVDTIENELFGSSDDNDTKTSDYEPSTSDEPKPGPSTSEEDQPEPNLTEEEKSELLTLEEDSLFACLEPGPSTSQQAATDTIDTPEDPPLSSEAEKQTDEIILRIGEEVLNKNLLNPHLRTYKNRKAANKATAEKATEKPAEKPTEKPTEEATSDAPAP